MIDEPTNLIDCRPAHRLKHFENDPVVVRGGQSHGHPAYEPRLQGPQTDDDPLILPLARARHTPVPPDRQRRRREPRDGQDSCSRSCIERFELVVCTGVAY